MSTKKIGRKTKKVLIAEDEAPMAQALQLKLTGVGFEADIAGDGEQAFKKALTGKYDLMLLDIVMPKMDGFAVLEALREKKIKTPVIISSNLSQDEDIKRAEQLGAVDFFVKSNTTLVEIVNKLQSFFKK